MGTEDLGMCQEVFVFPLLHHSFCLICVLIHSKKVSGFEKANYFIQQWIQWKNLPESISGINNWLLNQNSLLRLTFSLFVTCISECRFPSLALQVVSKLPCSKLQCTIVYMEIHLIFFLSKWETTTVLSTDWVMA